MAKPSKASMLIEDLTKVPNIVGGLGLSIAAAQKAFNADYLMNVEKILAMTRALGSGMKDGGAGNPPVDLSAEEKAKFDEFAALFKDLLTQLAPSRYQYTETTLSVKLDLAQTMDMSGSVGLGLGFGGVALNAAFAIGYGYDYRAAAECKTVIHAIPADQTVFKDLLGRAAKMNDKTLELPERSEVDKEIIKTAERIYDKLVGATPPQITSDET